MYCGRPSPRSIRSLSLAWAISRPTIIVPFSESRVATGYLDNSARISGIGRLRLIFTPPLSPASRIDSGIRRAGLSSIFSIQIPFLLIFALMLRSAEHETPIPTGHDAPWRGKRITRTSCVKYFPPNCAPSPNFSEAIFSFSSISRSRNACPNSLPLVGRLS
ncbi:hypothetical protein SDC9_87707 [bioreactor metagenome]|uniref:Uncharacterized protein n=1 Tax=bioreactor metagenome TaxID=1076179 RepID=A0A644ZL36_9ZZZZ